MNVLFYIAVFLIQFATYARNISFIQPISSYIVWIGIIILIVPSIHTMIENKWSLKALLSTLLLVSAAIVIAITISDSIFIQLLLVAIASQRLSARNIIKNDIIAKVIILGIIIFCYAFNLTITNVFIRNGETRYAFGFSQPNTYAYFILSIFMEYLYLKDSKAKKAHTALFGLASIFAISFSKSRTSLGLLVVILIHSLLSRPSKNLPKKTSKKRAALTLFVFVTLTIVSLISTAAFNVGGSNSKEILFINQLTSGRLAYQKLFLDTYPINLFGNNIHYFTTLDNAYLHLLLNFGVLGWLIFAFIYMRMSKRIQKENSVSRNIPLYLLLLGFMEWYTIRPIINVFITTAFSKDSLITEKNNESR